MFGIGMQELLIILVVALVVLGPTKLPGVARTIGKGMRELRRASDDLRSTIMFDDDEPSRGRYAAPPPPAMPASAPGADEAVTAGAPPDTVEPPAHIQGSLATADDGPVAREDVGTDAGVRAASEVAAASGSDSAPAAKAEVDVAADRKDEVAT